MTREDDLNRQRDGVAQESGLRMSDSPSRRGLLNAVVAPEELEAKTMALADRITELSPVALAMAKAAVKNAARLDMRAGLDAEVDLFALCFSSEDKEEDVRAFIEKRKPEFKDKADHTGRRVLNIRRPAVKIPRAQGSVPLT